MELFLRKIAKDCKIKEPAIFHGNNTQSSLERTRQAFSRYKRSVRNQNENIPSSDTQGKWQIATGNDLTSLFIDYLQQKLS